MAERPILFSSPMVRAILEGRKMQTRRVVRPQPPPPEAVRQKAGIDYSWIAPSARIHHWRPAGPAWAVRELMGQEPELRCPYGKPGDRLWVRETWRAETTGETQNVYYRADEEWHEGAGWKPSIHMPRWASRLTLEMTQVRVQRLQDISEEDAIVEGCPGQSGAGHPAGDDGMSPQEEFRVLWDSINGERPGCSWNANPWVWAISFQRLP